MKKIQTTKPTNTGRKRKMKWSNIAITAFAIVMVGGTLLWIAARIYNQEREELATQEKFNSSLPAAGVAIDHKLVCMVNNTYMGVDQIPVTVTNKTYYGCCDKCVRDLNTDESVRFAVDPYSQAAVDKANAFITINPNKKGSILYFESEQNAKNYFKK